MSISNCGIDERGKITGGKAGDNNGKEWRVRSWYSYPWNVVLRHPDSKVRAEIAALAKAAANNNNIGYDQSQRLTFWNQLKAVDYKPENIKIKCEADCSAGVCAIIKAVGYRLGNETLQNVSASLRTYTMRKPLEAAGFTALTASKYLKSDKYLLPGDILLKAPGHTAINLSKGSKATEAAPSITLTLGKRPTVKEWQLAAVADGFKFPKYGVDGEWGSECEKVAKKAIVKKRLTYKYKNLTKLVQKYLSIEVDGKCGSDTKAAIKEYQKQAGLVADGECGLNTWESILNV